MTSPNHQHLDFDRVCVLALAAAQAMAEKLPVPQGMAWAPELYSQLNQEQVFSLVDQFIPFLTEEGVLGEQARFDILMQQINGHHPEIDAILEHQQQAWKSVMVDLAKIHSKQLDDHALQKVKRLMNTDGWEESIPGSNEYREPSLTSILNDVSVLVNKPLRKPNVTPFPTAAFLEDRNTRQILFALTDPDLFERITQSEWAAHEVLKRNDPMVHHWYEQYKKSNSVEWRRIEDFFAQIQRGKNKNAKPEDLIYQHHFFSPMASWAAAGQAATQLFDLIFEKHKDVHIKMAKDNTKNIGRVLADKAKQHITHALAVISAQTVPDDDIVVVETPTIEQFRLRHQQDTMHDRAPQP